jgi:hypothetical protein
MVAIRIVIFVCAKRVLPQRKGLAGIVWAFIGKRDALVVWFVGFV